MSQTYSEPDVMMHIGIVATLGYLFGTTILRKTQLRRKLLYCIFKYSFLCAFYAKVYPYNKTFMVLITFYCVVLKNAIDFLN